MNRIREFRKAHGWSMQKLADATGTSKSQIDKLEKGVRRLTVDWMVRLAKPLNCDPRDFMVAQAPGTTPEGFQRVYFGSAGTEQPMIPVRGAVEKANAYGKKPKIFLTEQPIDHVPRPYYLAHAKDAYAIYVVGDAMAPMYRARQILFINPYKMPLTGSGVVVTDTKGAVLIREFISQKPNGISVREYQPKPRDFIIAQSDIATVHSVVGAVEP